jgi:carboxymethylenebutenolidase
MGTTISLTSSDGFELSAYRAEPEGTRSRGGVVVVQEIFGVNSHIRSVVDRYAAAGYLAIAPAIFDRERPGIELGYTPDDIEVGRGIATGLDFQKVLADVAAAGQAAREGGKVGVVGYCFGGRVTAAAAIHLGDVVDAASSYYGGGVVGLIDQVPTVPMIMHFGERDHAIPMEDVEKVAAAWRDVTVYVYDAEHGFNCDQRASFSAVPAAIAQARTFRFFADKLA